jgi:hypothetical protein
MTAQNPTDPSDQIRGQLAAAIARLEPYSRGAGVFVEDAVMAAIAVASYEINLALGALRRLSPPPPHRGGRGMRSTFPFNIGRFRRSNAHGGRIGGLHGHMVRPVSLAANAQHTREPPLSDGGFRQLLDSLIPPDEMSNHDYGPDTIPPTPPLAAPCHRAGVGAGSSRRLDCSGTC